MSISSGLGNTCFGASSGQAIVDSGYSTCVGYNAGFSNNKSENTFIGTQAGYNCNAIRNVFVGYDSGFSATSGTDNTIVGFQACKALTLGTGNSIFGSNAGATITTGGGNIIFGSGAGAGITTGNDNICIGGQTCSATTLGSRNVCIGLGAGKVLTSYENVLLGYTAGIALTTGANNSFIGNGAGATATTCSGSTALGCGSVVTGDNQVVLGNTGCTVIVPNTISFPNVPMVYVWLDVTVGIYYGPTTYATPYSSNNTLEIVSNTSAQYVCFNYGIANYGTIYFNRIGYNSSNGKFTPTMPGFYQITYAIMVKSCGCSYSFAGQFNGVSVLSHKYGSQTGQTINVTKVLYFNGFSDYFTIEFWNTSGTMIIEGSRDLTWFQAVYLHG